MTQPVKKTFIEFLHPGFYFKEHSSQQVLDRNEIVKLPENAFAYRYYDHETIEVNGKEFNGERSNVSNITYVDGKVLSIDDVKKSVPNNRILVTNMENHGVDYVVRTRTGNFQPLSEGDRVIQGDVVIYPDEKKFPPAQRQK